LREPEKNIRRTRIRQQARIKNDLASSGVIGSEG